MSRRRCEQTVLHQNRENSAHHGMTLACQSDAAFDLMHFTSSADKTVEPGAFHGPRGYFNGKVDTLIDTRPQSISIVCELRLRCDSWRKHSYEQLAHAAKA